MFDDKKPFFLRTKQHISIALRLIVFICLVIMSYQELTGISYLAYLALVIFLINTFLIYTKYFHLLKSPSTMILGFVIDLAAMTILVYYSSGHDRFYLVFLITVLMSATVHNLSGSFIISAAISIAYGLISLQNQDAPGEVLLSFPFLIKIAFLYVISTFIGYLSEEVERERREKELLQSELFKKERLALAGQMASGLAHDFFNILGGLKKLIEFSAGQDSAEEQRRVMQLTSRGIDRAITIVHNLLTYAKKPVPQLTLTDVGKIMEEVLAIVQSDFEKDKIKITMALSPIPRIKADPAQLHQVFLNILLNAKQSMLPKGGNLRIGIEPIGPDSVEIKISDSGCGIPPEIKDVIFEPFFSDRSTLGNKVNGMGLGLYVSNEIITTHNGRITINSEKNKGTDVIIRLPVK